MQAANLIATLDASFYPDPSLLWNAQPPATPDVSLAVVGSQLVIRRLNGYVGAAWRPRPGPFP